MWLLKLIKKLFFLVLFIVIVTILSFVFIGSLWYPNDYNVQNWGNLLLARTIPTGSLNDTFGIGNWYTGVLAAHEGLVAGILGLVIPVGFALVFGIIVYTLLSMVIGITWKLMRRSKKRKSKNDDR